MARIKVGARGADVNVLGHCRHRTAQCRDLFVVCPLGNHDVANAEGFRILGLFQDVPRCAAMAGQSVET